MLIINVNDYAKANCSKIIFSPDLENLNVNEEKYQKLDKKSSESYSFIWDTYCSKIKNGVS